jgi:hypothetical protein
MLCKGKGEIISEESSRKRMRLISSCIFQQQKNDGRSEGTPPRISDRFPKRQIHSPSGEKLYTG